MSVYPKITTRRTSANDGIEGEGPDRPAFHDFEETDVGLRRLFAPRLLARAEEGGR
jgi:hypothetical protein